MRPVGQQDEQGLIEAAQADPARFLDLYDCYFHRVWAYVLRRTGNRAEAEDVTAEVFQRALRNLKQFQWRGTPFLAWLLRIASNTLVDHWHKTARAADIPPGDTAEFDEDLERRALLHQLVERLPDAQRRVIELRFAEDKSLLEIATELGRSEGAVKQLQRRALETLRAEMEGRHG